MLTKEMSQTIEMALLQFKAAWQLTNKSDEERMAALDRIDAAQRWLYKEPTQIASLEQVPAVALVPAPDWSQAPKWANYWAMDATGSSFWHERKPEMDISGWLNGGKSRLDQMTGRGWERTLQQRQGSEGRSGK